MTQITEHFTLEEAERSATADEHGIVNKIPPHLYNDVRRTANMLERIRALPRIQRPIIVTSWYRCPELNSKVSKSRTSQHMYGQAADIRCDGLSNYELAKIIEEDIDDFDQLIYEGYTVHVSVPGMDAPPRRMALTQQRKSNGSFRYIKGIHDWT